MAGSFGGESLFTGEKALSEVNVMLPKNESMLAVGMISLALGILIGRFLHFEYSGFSVTDFIEGVLTGLSLVLNLAYLIRYSNAQRSAR